jgi:glycosyltransferase involved in cell wall biosynthesis
LATVRIFIPLFNAQDYILETLQSVVDQTYTDWDCVISDDKSTDNSVEIVKKFIKTDPRFTLILNEKHLNVAANWNLCKKNNVSFATKLLCSDDVLYPNCIAHQLKVLEDNQTSAVFSRRDIVLPSGRKITPHSPLYANKLTSKNGFELYIKSGRNIFGEPVSALFKTKDLLESNGFSEMHQYTLDLSGYLEITKDKFISIDKEVVGYFRVSQQQWSYRIKHKQNSAQLELKRFLISNGYVKVNKFFFIFGEIKGRLFTLLRAFIYKFG